MMNQQRRSPFSGISNLARGLFGRLGAEQQAPQAQPQPDPAIQFDAQSTLESIGQLGSPDFRGRRISVSNRSEERMMDMFEMDGEAAFNVMGGLSVFRTPSDLPTELWSGYAPFNNKYKTLRASQLAIAKRKGVPASARLDMNKEIQDTASAASQAFGGSGVAPETAEAFMTIKKLSQAGIIPHIDDSLIAEFVQAMQFAPKQEMATYATLSEDARAGLLGYTIGQLLSGGGAGLAGGFEAANAAVNLQQAQFDLQYKNAVEQNKAKIEALRSRVDLMMSQWQAGMTLAGQVAPTMISSQTQRDIAGQQLEFDRWNALLNDKRIRDIENAGNALQRDVARLNYGVEVFRTVKDIAMTGGFRAQWDRMTEDQRRNLRQAIGEGPLTVLLTGNSNLIAQTEADLRAQSTQAQNRLTVSQTALNNVEAEIKRRFGFQLAEAELRSLEASIALQFAQADSASAQASALASGAEGGVQGLAQPQVNSAFEAQAREAQVALEQAINAINNSKAGNSAKTQMSGEVARLAGLAPADLLRELQKVNPKLGTEGGLANSSAISDAIAEILMRSSGISEDQRGANADMVQAARSAGGSLARVYRARAIAEAAQDITSRNLGVGAQQGNQ